MYPSEMFMDELRLCKPLIPFLGLDFDPFSGEKISSSNTTGATCGAGTAYLSGTS